MTAALVSLAAAAHVVELTPANYDALVTSSGEDWLVEVYAPWCGHCKRLEPQYERAAEQLSGSVRLGRIDGARFRSLTLRFGVSGFPTIFHVQGATGHVRLVALAGHTAEAIVQYARKGWQDTAWKPLSIWRSPNGPLKRVLFMGMVLGERGAWRRRGQQCAPEGVELKHAALYDARMHTYSLLARISPSPARSRAHA